MNFCMNSNLLNHFRHLNGNSWSFDFLYLFHGKNFWVNRSWGDSYGGVRFARQDNDELQYQISQKEIF